MNALWQNSLDTPFSDERFYFSNDPLLAGAKPRADSIQKRTHSPKNKANHHVIMEQPLAPGLQLTSPALSSLVLPSLTAAIMTQSDKIQLDIPKGDVDTIQAYQDGSVNSTSRHCSDDD